MLGNSGPWLVCNDLWSMVDIFYFLVYITFCSWVSIGMLLVAMINLVNQVHQSPHPKHENVLTLYNCIKKSNDK